MAWFEMEFETSPEHEALVDRIHHTFFADDGDPLARVTPWQPHVSIAYDNPHDSPLDDVYADKLFARMPSLLGCKSRDVVAISLWKTKGTIEDWKCLHKVALS